MCQQESKATNNTLAQVVMAPGEWKSESPSEEWKIAQRKRLRNRIIGKKGVAATEPEGKFRAADIKIPLFIYNVDKSTTDNDIIAHVYNKSQMNISLQKLALKHDRGYNAYKVFVPKSKLDLFLNENFWPEGVLFRAFCGLHKTQNEKYGKPKQPVMGSTPINKNYNFVSFNCKGLSGAMGCLRDSCKSADIIALQETWLLQHDIPLLGAIDTEFAYTGNTAVDLSAGILRGRPYGGVALLWRDVTSRAGISMFDRHSKRLEYVFGSGVCMH
ncbi:unnamed protein product, partial [Iphiclides podalirius]